MPLYVLYSFTMGACVGRNVGTLQRGGDGNGDGLILVPYAVIGVGGGPVSQREFYRVLCNYEITCYHAVHPSKYHFWHW